MGRPTLYSPELLEAICSELAKGTPLTVICAPDGMPDDDTVRDWMKRSDVGEAVSRSIARARDCGHDAIALDALKIADDGTGDMTINARGEPVVNTEVVQRSKLRVWTRLQLLSKWDPKRYGERMQLAGDPEAPLTVTVHRLTDSK